MPQRLNAIRETVPVSAFAQDGSSGGDSDSSVDDQQDLVGPDERLRARLTPDTRLGWLAFFIAGVLGIVFLRWIWPLVPPWFTSTPLLVGYAGIAFGVAMWIHGRRGTLRTLQRFDLVVFHIGDVAIPKLGRIATTADKDPVFEELDTLGFAALSPRFQSVDDVFTSEGALQSKLHRRKKDGRWEPSRVRIDHVYKAEGDAPVFGNLVVQDASDLQRDSTAPEWDKTAMPPARPNETAARKLVERDRTLRHQVVPSLRERLETARGRLEALKEQSMDDPMIRLTELEDLLDTLQPNQQRQSYRQNGHGNGLQAQPEVPSVDEPVRDDIEARQEANDA